MINKICILASLAISLSAGASELKGVKMNDQLDVAGKNLVLNGLGVRQATIFKVSVYVAGLYLPAHSSDAAAILASNEPRAIEMEFVRDVGLADIQDVWQDSYKKNCASKCAELQPKFDEFVKNLTEVKKGDRARYTFLPDHMEYSVNGAAKARIEGPDFGKVMLAVWLGERPPNASLKEGMLGLTK